MPQAANLTPLKLLPPRAGLCQECATDHAPELPHNCESLYYCMKFLIETGRDPTWNDAMAHCLDSVKATWTIALNKLGVDVTSTNPHPQRYD